MTAKFDQFRRLHVPGNPLILFNAWDAGSAIAAGKAGAKAIATGSASVAAANGFGDGEEVPMVFALANAERIVGAVELPVTVDFEGGYAADPDQVAANCALLAATGAIGCNFEDQMVGGEGLWPVLGQCERLKAARQAVGEAFFINARTDIFLKAKPDAHDSVAADAAIERAIAYAEAGASGYFIPGLADLALVERITKASPIPVNAMWLPNGPTNSQWAGAGIARISHGPFPQMALMKTFEQMAREALA
ncbi:MAG TPA: isocitrate lyase/phosphoenolpyruvate mutase family protein [Sphingomicrobium sp.]|nr:isocitrate lyase/phosphoenolpyruvate mutase family protein [Sphingomicrobium sp.]